MKPQLPNDLLWAEDGHASDVVLTALADGAGEIVPESAHEHVHHCAMCTKQMGNLALLSLRTGQLFEAFSPREKVRFPVGIVLSGLSLAAVGLLPLALERPLRGVSETSSFVTTLRVASVSLVKVISHAAVSIGPVGSVSLSLIASVALLLLLLSVALTRSLRNS